MNEAKIREKALELVERSNIAFLGTIGSDGGPEIKAVQVADREGMSAVWISTNTSSERVGQLERDPRACLYFVQYDREPWAGLLLRGRVEIRRDPEARERLWEEGCEKYYPEGVYDPDYTVLRLIAERGKFWQFGTKVGFDLP